jgi:hypothetical protein
LSILTDSSNWPLGLPFALILVTAALYALGLRASASLRVLNQPPGSA